AEYWTGWSLAYYQWISDYRYEDIDRCVPIETIRGMYPTLHEADVTIFVDMMDESMREHREESRLKRLRTYAGLSQRALSDASGVPLRQIQLFEQGQRDITKTQGQTLYQLSRALGCSMEDLL
ncbi:MAG: helix-turn-helix transcriptional regulator, partial [Lachnospiraceae bacterium]|nr:helix-turn-helix transcriptional regulator [Lachnospiraceae bacterium]